MGDAENQDEMSSKCEKQNGVPHNGDLRDTKDKKMNKDMEDAGVSKLDTKENDPEPEERGVKVVYKNLFLSLLVMFLYDLSILVHDQNINQYLYRRVMQDLFGNVSVSAPGASVCYVNMSDPGFALQQQAQIQASKKQMNFTLTTICIGFVSLMLIAIHADHIPRKVLFLLPLTGNFLKYLALLLIIAFDLRLDFLYIGEAIQGLLGTAACSMLAIRTYTAENTPPKKSRTIALAFVNALTFFVYLAGTVSTGYFIKATGYMYPQLVTCLLVGVSICIVLFLLPDTLPASSRQGPWFTPVQKINTIFRFYVYEGTRQRRVIYFTGFLALFLFHMSENGASNSAALFVMNQPFCWSPEKIGWYEMAAGAITQVVGIPSIKLLQLVIPDEIIAIFGVIASFAGHVFHGFASTDWMMYGVPMVGFFAVSVPPTINAVLSRLTPSDRQGTLFAVISYQAVVMMAIGVPIFSSIYQETVTIFRGGVFLAMAVFDVVAFFVFIILAWLMTQFRRQSTASETDHLEA